jgi:DNA repair exonuclease SbcCD ATPase subunit
MYLLKLEAENYKSFEHVEIDFNDKGLVCVLGNTDDPLSPSNGAGKSTIRSAITWCWFGKNNAGQKADAVLSWFNPRNCSVKTILCTAINGANLKNKVEITRYRNHDKFENQIHILIDGKNSHYSDNDEAQKTIDAILGFNYDLFSLLLTAGANTRKMVSFVQMTDAERKEFMDYLLDLEYINNAKELVANDIKSKVAEICTIDNSIATRNAVLNDALTTHDEYKQLKERHLIDKKRKIDTIQTENSSLTAECDVLSAKLAKIASILKHFIIPDVDDSKFKARKEIINKKVLEAKGNKTKLTDEKMTLHSNIKATQLSITSHTAQAVVPTEPMQELKAKIMSVDKLITTEEANADNISKPKALTLDQTAYIDKNFSSPCAALSNKITMYNCELEKLEKKYASINFETVASTCDACGQLIMAETRAKYAEGIESTIETCRKSISDTYKEREAIISKEKEYRDLCISANKQDYNDRITKAGALIKDLKLQKSMYEAKYSSMHEEEAAKVEAAAVKNIEVLKKKLFDFKKEYAIIDEAILKIDSDISTLEKSIEAINDEHTTALNSKASAIEEKNMHINAYATVKSNIESFNKHIQRNDEQIEALKKEANPYIAMIDSIAIKIANVDKEIKAFSVGRSKLTDDLKYLDYWEKAFSNSGIKSFILDSVISMLNTKVNYCLDKLTNGEIKAIFSTQKELKSKKEMRENFNIKINKNGNDALFDDLSKGERCKTDTAVNYALQYLAETYHGAKLNFMFYDEALDGLDSVGCNQVIKFLREELERFNSIFVVTHNNDLRQNFDEVLIVEKNNGRTRITF